jgi:hypothetical protein
LFIIDSSGTEDDTADDDDAAGREGGAGTAADSIAVKIAQRPAKTKLHSQILISKLKELLFALA